MSIHKLSSIVAMLGLSAPLAAQEATNCSNGSGAAFGIVAYQCASCGFKHEGGKRPSYTFFAEPVVTQVDRPSTSRANRFVGDSIVVATSRPLFVIDGVVQGGGGGVIAVGDVIEAVDGYPITTQAGADVFTYPAAGSHALTVRRGRDRQVIDVSVSACGAATSAPAERSRIRGASATGFGYNADSARMLPDSSRRGDDGVHRGGSGAGSNGGTGGNTGSAASASGARNGSGFGRGVPVIGGDPIVVVNGTSATSGGGSSPAVGKFGFAVECRPSCALKRTPSGEYYYKYDGFPRIVEVRERSAADRAGLRIGDLITKVEGKSILDDDALHGSEQRDQLRITVRRDGKDIDVILLVVR